MPADTRDAIFAILFFIILALAAVTLKPQPLLCSVEHLDPRQPMPTREDFVGSSVYLVTDLNCDGRKVILIWHD